MAADKPSRKQRSRRAVPKGPVLRKGDALLIIDCINDLDFPGGENVLPWALRLVGKLSAFRRKARRFGMPVIYVNDNFGKWHSNFEDVYRHCTRQGALGREIALRLKPSAKDYFVLKPRHSGFFATSLPPLLKSLGVKRLVLSRIATNICVLFTAHDAYMHEYDLIVLSDCCAAESDFDHNVALGQLERFCNAKVRLSDALVFAEVFDRSRRGS